MAKAKSRRSFDVKVFLNTVEGGRSVSNYRKNQKVFAQSDAADAVFYIQDGQVKLSVISESGKEAVVALHGKEDFFGEGCLSGQSLRLMTAAAMTDCVIMRLDKAAIVRVLHEEPKFSKMFLSYILGRNARVEADLVDQLFNSSEKRLARLLLLMANFGKDGRAEPVIAKGEPADARRNGRNDAVARELFYEQVPKTRIHRVQRRVGDPQFLTERHPSR
jgi:CRP/FNR family cyclic AMP-dependent transcriptional regulator